MSVEPISSIDRERIEAVDRIKTRTPELLQANYAQTMSRLMSKGSEKMPRQGRGIRSLLERRGANQKDFNQKVREFNVYHRQNTFGTIVHVSTNIGDASNQVTLKAPSLLGSSASSGVLDEEIGNTNYVFAASNRLRSNSARGGGRKQYVIDSRDCFAVPMDIAHIHSHDFDGSETARLQFYANNIFTYDQFVEIFSAYTALLFDSPEEAVEFFERKWFYPDNANAWNVEELEETSRQNPDDAILLKMARLYKEEGIVPPISPEFQYLNQVDARLENIPEYS